MKEWRNRRRFKKLDGCGAAARFCDSHTCECVWPLCGGYIYHICMCGADWETDQPTWPLWDRVKYELLGIKR